MVSVSSDIWLIRGSPGARVEDQGRAAEADLGPVAQAHLVDPRPVDHDAVRRAEVGDGDVAAGAAQLGVVARDPGVVDAQVGVGAAADGGSPAW